MYSPRVWKRIQFANALRLNPTPAARRLEAFMSERFGRAKFRSERVVGDYIADFYFPNERVAVEVDGSFHDSLEQWLKDRRRDMEMSKRDVLVLRFRNEDVFVRSGWVIARVEAALTARRASNAY